MPRRNQAGYQEDRLKTRSEKQPKHQAEGQPKHQAEERPKHMSEGKPKSRPGMQSRVGQEERLGRRSEEQLKVRPEKKDSRYEKRQKTDPVKQPESEQDDRRRSRSGEKTRVGSEERERRRAEERPKRDPEERLEARSEKRPRNGSEERSDRRSEKRPKGGSEKKEKKKKEKEEESGEEKDGALSLIGTFLSTFVTVLIVLVAAVVVVTALLGWSMFSIDSYSMEPDYPYNSLVLVQNVDPSEIQVGDVITFVMNESGQTATHRVVSVNRSEQTFTTKGDANASNDANPVLWGNLVGKVVLRVPGLGGFLRTLTAQENRVWVIITIAALLAVSFAWDAIVRVARNHRRKKHPQPTLVTEPAVLPDVDLILAEALALEEDPEFDAGFALGGPSGAGPLAPDSVTPEGDHPVMDEFPDGNGSPTLGEALPEEESLTEDDVPLGSAPAAEGGVPAEFGSLTGKEVPISGEPAEVPSGNGPSMEGGIPTEDEPATEKEVPSEDGPVMEEEPPAEEGSLSEEVIPADDGSAKEGPSPRGSLEQGLRVDRDLPDGGILGQDEESEFQKENNASISVTDAPLTDRENDPFLSKDIAPATDSTMDEIVPETGSEDPGNNTPPTPENADLVRYSDLSLDYPMNEPSSGEEVSVPVEEETFKNGPAKEGETLPQEGPDTPGGAAREDDLCTANTITENGSAWTEDPLPEEKGPDQEEEVSVASKPAAAGQASAEAGQWEIEENPAREYKFPLDGVPQEYESRIEDLRLRGEEISVPGENETPRDGPLPEEEIPAEGTGSTGEGKNGPDARIFPDGVPREDDLCIVDTDTDNGFTWTEAPLPEEKGPDPEEALACDPAAAGQSSEKVDQREEEGNPAQESKISLEDRLRVEGPDPSGEQAFEMDPTPEKAPAETVRSEEKENPARDGQISLDDILQEDGSRIEGPALTEDRPGQTEEKAVEGVPGAEGEVPAEAGRSEGEGKPEPDERVPLVGSLQEDGL